MKIEYFLAIPLIILGIVNFTTWRSVRLLSKPANLLEEVDSIEDMAFLREHGEFAQWCVGNKFVHETNFLFHGLLNGPPLKCSAWWSSSDRTWALIYVTHMGKNIDFVTTYKGGVSLTTASSKDSLTLPSPPGAYIQAFTNTSNDERYSFHKNAVCELEDRYEVLMANDKLDLFDLISESILRQVAYIRTLPAWYLRGAYWYFISRNLKVNKKAHI